MSPVEVALIAIAAFAAYAVIAGFAFALLPEDLDERFTWAAIWPLSLAAYIGWQLATLGPRVVERRRQARRIPKATARQPETK